MDFLDACGVPSEDSPWVTDIVTPHYKNDYEKGAVPSGEDQPVPRGVSRVGRGGARAAAAGARRAKTRAGYGRMERGPDDKFDANAREAGSSAGAEARAARRAPIDEAQRAADVLADEGKDRLLAWVSTGGQQSPVGLAADEGQVRAAVRALHAAQAAKGLDARPPFGAWVQDELQRIRSGDVRPAAPPAARLLDLGELEALIARHTKKGEVQFNDVARAVTGWGLPEADREQAAQILQDRVAEPGHLEVLREGG